MSIPSSSTSKAGFDAGSSANLAGNSKMLVELGQDVQVDQPLQVGQPPRPPIDPLADPQPGDPLPVTPHDPHQVYGDPQAHDPLNPGYLFGKVQDTPYFEIPSLIGRVVGAHENTKIYIPQPINRSGDAVIASPMPELVEPVRMQVTKYMVLEITVAILVTVVFVQLARRIRNGIPARGRWWNMMEVFVAFIRNEIARPAIGRSDADRFVPLICTLFFFVLGCNLLGLIPWMGTATGELGSTAVLALVVFVTVIGTGMKKFGVLGFFKAQWPHLEMPFVAAILLSSVIFVIELFGLLVKHVVLAIRLLANMMAGHLVLLVLMSFVVIAAQNILLLIPIGPLSIGAAVAFMLLELFIAFLQAYLFAFLSAIFIGAAVHPH